MAHGVLRVI